MLLVSVNTFIPSELTENYQIVQQHGEEHQFRIDRGVQQFLSFDRKDGNHQEFIIL